MLALSTFQCPNCHEYINTGMDKCKFCSLPIDPGLAGAAVELQEKINQACNQASLIRNLAGVMWVGFLVRFIPIVGLVGWVPLLIGFFILPFWLVYWAIRYSGIRTPDVDYKRAQQNALMATVLWVLMLIVPVVLIIFAVGLSAALNGR